MTTKKSQTTTKASEAAKDLQLAHEIHTLVHLIRRRIAPAPPPYAWEEPLFWPPTPCIDASAYRSETGPWTR